MKNPIIILENIRSAYNVWNIIRTADALGRDVWITGYTPSPEDSPKVKKTALWADENVNIIRFDQITDALVYAAQWGIRIIAAEITDKAVSLSDFSAQKTLQQDTSPSDQRIAVVFGNEVDGVSKKTLDEVDKVVYIPMNWIKESLNVGQSAAIFMRELQS